MADELTKALDNCIPCLKELVRIAREVKKKNEQLEDRIKKNLPIDIVISETPSPKRERAEEEKKEEEKPKKQRTKKADVVLDHDVDCAGRVWETPPTKCQGSGTNRRIEAKIQFKPDGEEKNKSYKVCKACKLAKAAFMKQQKKKDD